MLQETPGRADLLGLEIDDALVIAELGQTEVVQPWPLRLGDRRKEQGVGLDTGGHIQGRGQVVGIQGVDHHARGFEVPQR